jgi:hypothetical protein
MLSIGLGFSVHYRALVNTVMNFALHRGLEIVYAQLSNYQLRGQEVQLRCNMASVSRRCYLCRLISSNHRLWVCFTTLVTEPEVGERASSLSVQIAFSVALCKCRSLRTICCWSHCSLSVLLF